MSNQENFEKEAKAIVDRNQAAMDLKLFLAHWGGYNDVKTRHKKRDARLSTKIWRRLRFQKVEIEWALDVIKTNVLWGKSRH